MAFTFHRDLEPDQYPDEDMFKVRAMCARLASPHWMRSPSSWMWTTGDGRPQGFGVLAYDRPGLANLLWLSMEMDVRPQTYEATHNSLYVLLFQQAEFARLGGVPLTDAAGMLTLHEFVEHLPTQQELLPSAAVGAERAYPLLRLLAERRLSHANT